MAPGGSFNIVCVAQAGRLEAEAILLAATLRLRAPRWGGDIVVMEPQPGGRWPGDPRLSPEGRAALEAMGARILPFPAERHGEAYPQGNKMEALAHAPQGPFLFLDTDTVIVDDLADVAIDFDRPAASMAREHTWPEVELYGPSLARTWGSLHRARGLDFEASLDPAWPEASWRRYLYFNAGWTFGADAPAFGRLWLEVAEMVERDPPPELACQTIWPWLDQIALPLVVHELGGGRPGGRGGIADGVLDGSHSFHWRVMGLLYATAPDRVIEAVEEAAARNAVKKLLKRHEPFRRFLYQGRGARARAMFDRDALPRKEQAIRNRLKRANLWTR